MTAPRRGRKGFTLIEVLVTIVIFGVMLAAVMVSWLMTRNAYSSADAYIHVQQEARRAFDEIVRELHESGRVNNSVSVAEPGAQRLDFQIVRSYDAAACGGICWGTDDATLPSGWIHYILDTSSATNARVMRCVTANRLDPMPGGYAGCRVLANSLDPALASTAFVYDHPNRTVIIRLRTRLASQELAGGAMAVAPATLSTRVQLRNN